MLKVHKTGNKYYNKNNICVTRESERTRARNRKRKSKRKESRLSQITQYARARYMCGQQMGAVIIGRGGDG